MGLIMCIFGEVMRMYRIGIGLSLLAMPSLERSRLEVTYPVRDSIEIRFWIRVADARNVEYRFEVPMKGVSGAWTTQSVATWSGDRDWEEVRYRFYLPDTIIQFLPRLRIRRGGLGIMRCGCGWMEFGFMR
jgi:hypothetical protein